jgi:hypothetical protein
MLPQIARSRLFPANTLDAEVQFVCIHASIKETDYLMAISQVSDPNIQRSHLGQAMALLSCAIGRLYSLNSGICDLNDDQHLVRWPTRALLKLRCS